MEDFCKMCGNLMYIKMVTDESAEQRPTGIIHYCKNCGFEVPRPENTPFCIHTSMQDESMKYSVFLNPNIKHDPTLPHVSIPCPNQDCNKDEEAEDDVIYMKYDHANMKYIYFCTHCEHFWKMDDEQKNELEGGAECNGDEADDE